MGQTSLLPPMVGFIYTFWYSHLSSSEGFQQHFSIISKSVFYVFYMKKNIVFTLISFAILNEMIVYQFICHLSNAFELLVQLPVELLLELEPN